MTARPTAPRPKTAHEEPSSTFAVFCAAPIPCTPPEVDQIEDVIHAVSFGEPGEYERPRKEVACTTILMWPMLGYWSKWKSAHMEPASAFAAFRAAPIP